MPRWLVIDCATEACSVALFDGEELCGARLIDSSLRMLGRGHAEQLVPMIEQLNGSGRADSIVVSLGPGSFTGVRVGLAAARALGLAWNAPVTGYATPDLVQAMARAMSGESDIAVAMTGGHGEWFVSTYDPQGAHIGQSVSLTPTIAAATVQARLVAGSQAEALVKARGSGRALPIWPDAGRASLLQIQAYSLSPTAHYGRPPDAKLPEPPK